MPLAEVLDRAGIAAAAREVVFRGADSGRVDERDDRVRFERSLPVERLGHSGALLAYAMNGEELRGTTGGRCGWWSPAGTRSPR